MLVTLRADAIPPTEYFDQRVHYLVSGRHFDFVLWEAAAGLHLVAETAASPQAYLTEAQRKAVVVDYLARVRRIHDLEWQLNRVYSTQEGENAAQAAEPIRAELRSLRQIQARRVDLVEGIVAEQVESVLIAEGLGQQGYLWPPVEFCFEPLPLVLIISPRDEIRVQAEVHLKPGVPLDEWEAIEDRVDTTLNVSSLVTEIGGLSTYPAMVYETASVNWLMDTVAHEWTHDYLAFHPLGWNYDTSPELRTMNETVASLRNSCHRRLPLRPKNSQRPKRRSSTSRRRCAPSACGFKSCSTQGRLRRPRPTWRNAASSSSPRDTTSAS